jgi:outer membrane protein TolC
MQVMLTRNNILPALALKGGVAVAGAGDDYGESFENTMDDGDLNWGLGLIFSMPLGNRDARGRYMRAQAELSKSRHNVELLRQDLQRSVREAVREVDLSTKAISASRKSLLAAKKGLEAEQEKFDVGLSTALDVLNAQESYAQSLVGEKIALVGYAKAIAEIERVRGGINICKQ